MRFAGLAGLLCLALSTTYAVAEPKHGGKLVTSVQGDVDTYDCHATISTPAGATVLPSYSLLLRYDTENDSKIIGDLAESWDVSADGLTYTFKIHDGVKFHDGTDLTSEDIKASYDRIRQPPQGVVSLRQAEFVDVTSVDAPDPHTIVFKLSSPNSGLISSLASPWNCIYSAALLKSDPTYPKNRVMGSGPFQFVSHDRGARWTAKRFDDYFVKGEPYLDGIEIAIMQSSNALVNAISGGQVDGTLGLLAPPEIARIKSTRGDKTQFIASPAITLVFATFNSKREPFNDERVRRALNLAIDRYTGVEVMRKLTNLDSLGGLIRPGYKLGLAADQLERFPGYSKDIAASRAEAKKLLAEAGHPNLKIKFLNRNTAIPYQPIGVFLADQWRQIGVETEMVIVDMAPYLAALQGGDFDVALDFNTQSADTPAVLFNKYVPGAAGNYGGYDDPELKELFNTAKRALDDETVAKAARAFEDRMMAKSYIAPLFWATRTAALPADLKGWKSDPSYYVGWDMARAWRDQ